MINFYVHLQNENKDHPEISVDQKEVVLQFDNNPKIDSFSAITTENGVAVFDLPSTPGGEIISVFIDGIKSAEVELLHGKSTDTPIR